MTAEHAIIAALSTLLIVGLLIYLRGKFHRMAMTPEERMDDLLNEYNKLVCFTTKVVSLEEMQKLYSRGNDGDMPIKFQVVPFIDGEQMAKTFDKIAESRQPKRRKHRDNK
jgi:hypothetical protein